jgi:hypothetical protein
VGGYAATVNTASITGNINSILNGTAVFGNLIPSANVTYSLGNITHQWNDLFVSNNTIFVGGVPLTIDNTGNLRINGNVIPTIGYVNTVVANVTVDLSSYALNANVTAANVGLKGYVDQANTIQSAQLTSANVGIIGYINQGNTIQSAQITAANVGMRGYVDQANTIQSAQVNAANLAITAANVGLKGYVDAQTYTNVNVTSYFLNGASKTFAGNLTIEGNLFVNGNVNYISVNNIAIGDNIINLADLNPADSLDLGLTAHRTVNGLLQHTGLIRDASANQWRLFSNVVQNPGTTVDFTDAIYDDLQLGNITSPTITAINNNIAAANAAWAFANTIQSAQVTAANLAITTANVGMKGYVDSQSFYSNVKVETYLPTYDGNIAANISKAGYTWTFGTDAVLTLPSGATILESGYGSAGAIRLKPNGGTSTQYLEIAPTAVDGNHVHLMAGSGTELFLGDDNHYVKLANTGGVVINSNDGAGNTAQWTFGKTGTTQFPNSLILAPVSQSITMQSDQYSQLMWENANLTVAPNMAVNSNFYVAQNSATLDIGYLDGNSSPQFKSWYWSVDGNLKLPSGGYILNSDDSIYGGSSYSNVQVATYLQSGNIANVSVAGNVTATYFVGNGALLTGIVGGASNYGNVDVRNFLKTGDGASRLIQGYYANIDLGATARLFSFGATAKSYFGHDGQLGNASINWVRADNGDVRISTNNAAYNWIFDNTGNLTLPGATAGETIATSGGYITVGNLLIGQGGSLFNSNNDSWALYGNRSDAGTSITIPSNDSAGNGQPIRIDNQISNVEIVSGNNTWAFSTDGNLTLPGNVAAINYANGVSILTGLGGSGTNYSNVNVQAYTETMGFKNYSNVNVAAYLSTATINTTGNITAAYLVGNISITGNVTGTSSNVTLQAGAYTSVFDNQGNVTVPRLFTAGNIQTAGYFVGNGAFLTGIVAGSSYSNVQVATYLPTYSGVVGASNVFVSGNVTAQYFLGNGALLTGIASSYSNVQVATYLPTYTGNVANVRLGTSGILTFSDGTQQTTAAFGGGGNYGNANVAAFLPTYTGTTGITQIGTLATLSVSGNATVGNLVGTEANTRIIANVYTTTFDIYGNVSFPGNITTSSSGYFVGNALGTTAAYTGNVTVGGNLTIIGTKSNVPVKTGGFVAQNTAVSIDSITAQWLNTGGPSANQLQLAALNGNVSILYTYTFQDGTGGSTTGGSSSTTLANLSFGWTSIGNPSGVAGDMYNVLVSLPGTNAYRITAMTGSGYSDNVLTVERLI